MDRSTWTHIRATMIDFIAAHEGQEKTGEEWFRLAKCEPIVKRMTVEDVRAEVLRMMCRETRLEPMPSKPGSYRAPKLAGRSIG